MDKVSIWIKEQLAQGKTAQELYGTTFINGDSVVKIKKAGKGFHLDIQVGCPVL